jgi:Ca2+-binding EF-hand superfamily protein
MSQKYTEAQINQMKKIFNRMDVDGNGYLDKNEFLNYLIEARLHQQWSKLLFYVYDSDGSGTIERKEFFPFLDSLIGTYANDDTIIYQTVFSKLDNDNNGFLDDGELAFFCSLLNHQVDKGQFTKYFKSVGKKGFTLAESMK